MPEAFHDFDEGFDEDEAGKLLPPEDRLWRHPSEVAWEGNEPLSAEVSAARERWLSRTPTRAGAWSAGVVGAVLATGVVLVGTHLTDWLGRPAAPSRAAMVATTLAQSGAIDISMARSAIDRIQTGQAVIEVTGAGGTAVGDGVVLDADGKILVPLPLVAKATAIAVTTSDGAVYAGRVIGTDPATELAVVSIGCRRSTAFAPLGYTSESTIGPGDWLGVEWSELSRDDEDVPVFRIGSVSASAAASTMNGSYQLLDMLQLRALGVGSAPLGAAIVNGSADLLGIVTERQGDVVVETPAVLAEEVGRQILEHGRVVHGWLGIVGESTSPLTQGPPTGGGLAPRRGGDPPPGVEVLAVGNGSSAARAGLRAGDVIEAVDGEPVDSMQALQATLYVLPPETDVSLTVERDHALRTVEALLQPAA